MNDVLKQVASPGKRQGITKDTGPGGPAPMDVNLVKG